MRPLSYRFATRFPFRFIFNFFWMGMGVGRFATRSRENKSTEFFGPMGVGVPVPKAPVMLIIVIFVTLILPTQTCVPIFQTKFCRPFERMPYKNCSDTKLHFFTSCNGLHRKHQAKNTWNHTVENDTYSCKPRFEYPCVLPNNTMGTQVCENQNGSLGKCRERRPFQERFLESPNYTLWTVVIISIDVVLVVALYCSYKYASSWAMYIRKKCGSDCVVSMVRYTIPTQTIYTVGIHMPKNLQPESTSNVRVLYV